MSSKQASKQSVYSLLDSTIDRAGALVARQGSLVVTADYVAANAQKLDAYASIMRECRLLLESPGLLDDDEFGSR